MTNSLYTRYLNFDVPDDIDRRRQEIREKILRKSKERANIYLGIALVIIIFASLLFSNLYSGGQNVNEGSSSPVATGSSGGTGVEESKSNMTKTDEQNEKETAGSEVKAELMPPVPEGFNESNFTKVSIVDDSQSVFWSNLYPTSVRFEDSSDSVSGNNSLKVEFIRERPGGLFAEKTFNELQDWSDARYISFWFKGSNSGLIYDIYIYFDRKWSNYVILRVQDVYDGWVRFVFSTEKNIIKNGDVDWSKVWKIRIANNNKKFTGEFYFDDFAIWTPKKPKELKVSETKVETRIYGIGDTIIKGNFEVTLNKWYPIYKVESYVGGKVVEFAYSRVDITVKYTGDEEVYLSFTPYKPVLVDDDGKIYEYTNVKVRRSDGLVVEHPDQLKLGVLYPGTSRSGAIFFYPVITLYTDKVRLVLYLNKEKFEFVWPRGT